MKKIIIYGIAACAVLAAPTYAQGRSGGGHGGGLGASMGGGLGVGGGMGGGLGHGSMGIDSSLNSGIERRDVARADRMSDERASLTGRSHANANAGFAAVTDDKVRGKERRAVARSKRQAYHASDRAKARANANAGLATTVAGGAASERRETARLNRHAYEASATGKAHANANAGLSTATAALDSRGKATTRTAARAKRHSYEANAKAKAKPNSYAVLR